MDTHKEKSQHKFPKDVFLKKWSWGGFLMPGIWALGSRLYVLGVLGIVVAFIPRVSLVLLLILGIFFGLQGRRRAWESGQWKDFEVFRKRQNTLDNVGFILMLVAILFAFVAS